MEFINHKKKKLKNKICVSTLSLCVMVLERIHNHGLFITVIYKWMS